MNPEKPLDTTIEIVTPEHIAFAYRLAGPFRRLPAFLIDLILRVSVFVASFIVLSIAGALSGGGFFVMASFVLVWFVMEWLYGGLLETYWNGQTIGKRVLAIRVLAADGQPITGLQAMMRNILRFADMMPLVPFLVAAEEEFVWHIPCFLVGLVVPLCNSRFQRIGDLVCGTMVVMEEPGTYRSTVRFDDPRVAMLADEIPVSFVVTRSLAKSLATYVERRHLFSPARRHEIATHLASTLVPHFGLPADTSYDLLVCALYHRTFAAKPSSEATLSISAGVPA